MNTETAVVVALVLAMTVVALLYGSGVELMSMGEESLFEFEDNVSEADDDHWFYGEEDDDDASFGIEQNKDKVVEA